MYVGCGAMFLPMTIPMKPAVVRAFVRLAQDTCISHGIDPLLQVTVVSNNYAEALIHILFDSSDATEVSRAHDCYGALLNQGIQQGFGIDRLLPQVMPILIDSSMPFWRLVQKFKTTIDPGGILAPGKYCPYESGEAHVARP